MRVKRPLPVRLYSWLFEALTPFWQWWLNRRFKRGKETALGLEQRWVRQQPSRPEGKLIWGHAVGVGEALALAGLLRRLHLMQPDLHFLMTTTARTSSEVLTRQELGEAFLHSFAPVDTPSNVEKFLDHWRPDLAIWCELDLWPALISETACREIPHVLINARMSERTFLKRRPARSLYRPMLCGFDSIWVQNAESANHLVKLGAQVAQIQVTGNIKAFAPPLHVNTEELQKWREALGARPVWLLASSHDGEEALALDAHRLIREHCPDALLIIVPRDASRGPALKALGGPDTTQRSAGDLLPTTANHYIADTMGELGLWYRLCRIAMIGGSWVAVGGHNPYEAIALNCRVLHGPQLHNFLESYTDLDATGRSMMVQDADQIAQQVMKTWSGRNAGVTPITALDTPNTDRLQQLLSLVFRGQPTQRHHA